MEPQLQTVVHTITKMSSKEVTAANKSQKVTIIQYYLKDQRKRYPMLLTTVQYIDFEQKNKHRNLKQKMIHSTSRFSFFSDLFRTFINFF
jgi:hypothetical protein